MNPETQNSKISRKNLLRIILIGSLLSFASIFLVLSGYYELRLRYTIRKDFEDLYPEYESVNYEFDFTKYRKSVKIIYGQNNSHDRQLEWEYVFDYDIGWANYDSVMITIDTIIDGSNISYDIRKDQNVYDLQH